MNILKKILGFGSMILSFISPAQAAYTPKESAYSFQFKTLIGDEAMPLSDFKGKVVLVVNTASKCGLTQQYEGLENLYKKYEAQGLVIIGVPSNDFGGQEPGSNEEIAHFCSMGFKVSFPMAAKEVVSGDAAHPFYIWAKKVLGFGTAPKWNFHKYLINRDGELVDYFNSTTKPESDNIVQAIENALKSER